MRPNSHPNRLLDSLIFVVLAVVPVATSCKNAIDRPASAHQRQAASGSALSSGSVQPGVPARAGQARAEEPRLAATCGQVAPSRVANPPPADVIRPRKELDLDLTTNALLGHVYDEGVVVDAGSAGAVKYLRDIASKWRQERGPGKRPLLFPPGRQAELFVPIGPEQNKQPLVVETLLLPLRQERVAVFVNDLPAGEFALDQESGVQVRATIPDKVRRPGIAHVRLYFSHTVDHLGLRTPAGIRYLRIVEAARPALDVTESALAARLLRVSGQALLLPPAAGLDYYIAPTADMRVRAFARGGELEVLAQLDGGAPRQLARGEKVDVPLASLGGKPFRLMLRGAAQGTVQVYGAGVVGGRGAPPIKRQKPKYIVFWLIDSLRADKLGFYQSSGRKPPKRVKTPNLDAAVREGTLFDPYWVTSNESKASHASYFTGTYPARHGVLNHEAKLRDEHVTLAEGLKTAGYRTAAFIANGYISSRWNFVQGFDSEMNFIRLEQPSGADTVVAHALPWIDANKDKPFYLYLGTNDPHVTYTAHDEFLKDYFKGPYNGPYKRMLAGVTLGKIKERKNPPSAIDQARIEALYDSEVAFNDFHFGRLVAHLKQLGIYDETLLIVASDHGEEFWDHGSCGHGHNLQRELVSVPLFFRYPGVFPAAKVASGHDGVDLLPTIFELAQVTLAPETQGESMLRYIGAEGVYPRAMLASDEGGSHAIGINNVKVIFNSPISTRAYDLSVDPEERHDRSSDSPVLLLSGLDPISVFAPHGKTWRKADCGVANNLLPGCEFYR